MVFGIFKATNGALDWNAVSSGNKIQVFAQILYGYGYWGPFALEYEKSTVDCGTFDLERALAEYSYVTSYQSGNLNPTIATYFTTELNGKIKENLYCLVRIITSLTFMVCMYCRGFLPNVTFGPREKSHYISQISH